MVWRYRGGCSTGEILQHSENGKKLNMKRKWDVQRLALALLQKTKTKESKPGALSRTRKRMKETGEDEQTKYPNDGPTAWTTSWWWTGHKSAFSSRLAKITRASLPWFQRIARQTQQHCGTMVTTELVRLAQRVAERARHFFLFSFSCRGLLKLCIIFLLYSLGIISDHPDWLLAISN